MGDPVQLKDEGNKHFQAGDIDKAIECYSSAIKMCTDKKMLAVIHRNRSACYLKKVSRLLKHYKGNIRKTKTDYLQIKCSKSSRFSVFLKGKVQ